MTNLGTRLVLRLGEGNLELAFRLIQPPIMDGVAIPVAVGGRGGYWDEEPACFGTIEKPYWLAETAVTQAQFAVWTRAQGVKHENQFPGRPDHPAENLDWRQANQFCAWLTAQGLVDFPAGHIACLPTETEWEYACRAGTDSEYYSGDGAAALSAVGSFGGDWDAGAPAVGQKPPNDFGLLDVHGGVWEWCHDVWNQRAYRERWDGEPDPGAVARALDWRTGLEAMLASDQSRVLRGGAWFFPARYCRSAYRSRYAPDDRRWGRGFRVCLVPGPASQFRAIEAAGERRPAR